MSDSFEAEVMDELYDVCSSSRVSPIFASRNKNTQRTFSPSFGN